MHSNLLVGAGLVLDGTLTTAILALFGTDGMGTRPWRVFTFDRSRINLPSLKNQPRTSRHCISTETPHSIWMASRHFFPFDHADVMEDTQ